MIRRPHDSLQIGTLAMIAGLQVPGRVIGIAKDRSTLKYNVRYLIDGRFREAVFAREQLTLVGRAARKPA